MQPQMPLPACPRSSGAGEELWGRTSISVREGAFVLPGPLRPGCPLTPWPSLSHQLLFSPRLLLQPPLLSKALCRLGWGGRRGNEHFQAEASRGQ